MISNTLRLDDDFSRIYQKYKNTVFGVAINYTKNDTDANDVLQEVFYKYLNNNKPFESEEHAKAWLIRVTINMCKKHLLSFRMKRTMPLDEAIEFEDVKDSEVFYSVMSLPKAYRLAIHLFYYEGYSALEIAKILNIKEGAVKMRLSRARKMLKQKLEEEWKDEYS